MTRRDAFALTFAAPFVQTAKTRPNLIVILTDDHGYHDLGCQGATDVKTPNIDSLAKGGTRFTDWYSCAPMCAPSRAALMTGRYPQRCGVPNNAPTMHEREILLTRILKEQGYATGVFGKWHLGDNEFRHPNARGFDEFFGFHVCNDHYSHRNYWFGGNGLSYHDLWHNRTEVWEEGRYSTELWTDKALEWLERQSSPFFLYLPYSALHYPMHAPRRYLERFAHLKDAERQVYAAMLSCVDDNIGRVLEFLDRRKLRDNTLIAFTSDNGATREPRAGRNREPAKGGINAPHRGAKFSLFDGGIRVPGILNWPARLKGGQVSREPVMTADILPTFAAAAGVRLPQDRTYDGRDILPVASGKSASPHASLHWAAMGQVAVRRGNWKWIRNVIEADGTERGLKPIGGESEMFLADLLKDPGETTNLRRQHPDVAAELEQLATNWLKNVVTN